MTITLTRPDGVTFEAAFGEITPNNFDDVQRAVSSYDAGRMMALATLDLIESDPTLLEQGQFAPLKPFWEKYMSGVQSREQLEALMLRLTAAWGGTDKKKRYEAAIEIVRQTAETADKADAKLLKLPATHQFWWKPDNVEGVRAAADFFRAIMAKFD